MIIYQVSGCECYIKLIIYLVRIICHMFSYNKTKSVPRSFNYLKVVFLLNRLIMYTKIIIQKPVKKMVAIYILKQSLIFTCINFVIL